MIYAHSPGRAARLFPDQAALWSADRWLTFAELDHHVAGIAGALSKHGFAPGDRLAVLMPNGVDYLELVYACVRLGVIVVPLNVRVVELDRILADARPHGLIRHSSLPVPTVPLAWQLVLDQQPLDLGDGGSRSAPINDPDAVLALIYTSGTTGHPKGVVVLPTAREAARMLATRPLGAIVATKKLMRDRERILVQMRNEEAIFRERLKTAEAQEAFAAFFERRQPDFSKFVLYDRVRQCGHLVRRDQQHEPMVVGALVEEMVKLDGTPLYPQRICDTLGFDLIQGPGGEQELYDETSKYIRDIYNKASTLNRSAARLAMTVFQRRLASSTYALKKSFERRAEKLSAAIKAIEENGLEAVRKAQRDLQKKAESNELDLFASATADDDAGDGAEAVEAGESETLGALVTENLADLLLERDRVLGLLQMAQDLLDVGRESKFAKLLDTMKDPRFADEKMLVFTEHRDTANYLTEQFERLGFAGRVAQLHGAMDYVERDRQVEFFRKAVDDGGAKYLIGTDAAGEGVNLQFCWLMVNYDVPWNPARLEQRMGRIHRYGQKKDAVYIANLVAWKTREGRVMKTLLDKMETIRKELGSDKVFDVIGRLFENVSLKSYLDAAIRGEDVADGIEGVLTIEQVRALEAKERALYGNGGEVKARLPAMREDIERERYLRLMPGYMQRLVERSAPLLGLGIDGDVSAGFRFKVQRQGAMDAIAPEIETYPAEARQRLMVRRPVLGEEAIWLHPGEPVFDAISGELQERFGADALRGAAFVDPHAKEASLFHIATTTVLRHGPSGDDVLEHRLVGLRQGADGSIQECPVEWLLLLRGAQGVKPGAYPVGRECLRLLREAGEFLTDVLGAGLVTAHRAVVEADLPQRLDLVKAGFNRQEADLARARNRLRQAAQDGKKQAAVQLDLVKMRHSALSKVRESRLAAIKVEPSQIVLGPVRFIAHALVVPSIDPEDEKRFDAEVEAVAVKLAMAHEENAGGKVRDVSTAARARAAGLSDFPGFDVLSERPSCLPRCIEVKGRADRGEIFMTQNEWAKAANLGERYWLYAILDCATPKPSLLRVQDPFTRLLGAAKGGMTFTAGDIRALAEQD